MIRPNKHAHPDKTLVAAAYKLLRRLKTRRIESYDGLRKYLTVKDKDIDSLFLPALSLLYVLGLVEYRKKNDSFEYTGS